MHIYDHEQALLGGHSHTDRGIERLNTLKDRLGITGGPITGGNPHVFLPHIKSCTHLYKWAEQIREIPPWFIASVCLEAQRHGLDNKLAKETNKFLQYRRERIVGIIDANRGSFAIDDWPQQKRMV